MLLEFDYDSHSYLCHGIEELPAIEFECLDRCRSLISTKLTRRELKRAIINLIFEVIIV